MIALSDRTIEIAKAWYAFEDVEDDISTERLIAQVRDKCRASMDDVMKAMERFSAAVIQRQQFTRESNKEAIEMLLN